MSIQEIIGLVVVIYLFLASISTLHNRFQRAYLVKRMLEMGMPAEDIELIIRAYNDKDKLEEE